MTKERAIRKDENVLASSLAELQIVTSSAARNLTLARAERGLLGFELPAAVRFYQQMMLIRLVEERLLDLFSQGLLFGTTHTSIGQEANAVGVINALDRDRDIVWSNHRCHGHFIAYSGEVEGLIAEIMGRVTGICGGRGGSQHLCFRNFHSNGIQGGIAPVAVGSALARKDEGAVAVVFLGDGTMGEGAVYESLNLASVFAAPVVFVIEDNEIAQTTPKHLTVSGSIVARAEPFGVRTFAYDGNDPIAIYELAQEAIGYVRAKSRPCWLYLRTERIGPHSKGDDTRPAERLEQARARDPIPPMRRRVANADEIDAYCLNVVDRAVESAAAAALARG
ncbi:thiamine pyrophosphate-dependent dehydrogenase E1 component subunit alpha [Mesorhizobium sp. BR1-1-13]|uniref:thiamine pyrophosphate-dependent dehydrogenase E1 component subunit alpha n=1 Tax=Mesorhizobium sp. BR1-1-13 TaxID=2876656 RepID=UPI001CD04CEA|nr:thiamine pyrophosphate-dependent dehydrogenase E1 component subunit alpha [Mesorhizobium sp. BR1-1-13]MBZ9943105.1 thiamine pyrophosphate-dependent dehydrogenase E1 component subunit alpha [Mesorhizobium sp. BR1-1-13]